MTESKVKQSFRTCNADCCEDAKRFLLLHGEEWRIKFAFRTGQIDNFFKIAVKYCPWCGWKLKV